MSFLKVKGKDIINAKGEKVFLRGVSFGGWLNMENFITGYIGSESIVRRAIKEELGEERYIAFFESLLDSFIKESDFKFLSEIGVTAVRVPFNYRHFEDDLRPGEYDDTVFKYLDKVISWGEKYNIYIILDLHAAQGWQNEGWHSDNPHNIALLWKNRDYIERVKNLWIHIAKRYKDKDYIAGYDLLNEPEAPDIDSLNMVYHEIVDAIRAVDKKHIIFLEGNSKGTEFEGLEEPFDENLAYSSHNYNPATHVARKYPGYVNGTYIDKKWLEEAFLERNNWILDHKRPSWIGEFGALYDGSESNLSSFDLARLNALKDQIDIFNKYEQHWTIWTYKDIGVQGLVVPKGDCEYIRRMGPINKIKEKLGLDVWTSRDRGLVRSEALNIVRKVADLTAEHMKDYSLDYNGRGYFKLGRQAITSSIANTIAPLYADQFLDMTVDEIKEMHREAFSFEKCQKRQYLIDVLKELLK
ncbi:glycoside hydrolase family 5 protein [Natronospora cellulosivora (SeqCode)]